MSLKWKKVSGYDARFEAVGPKGHTFIVAHVHDKTMWGGYHYNSKGRMVDGTCDPFIGHGAIDKARDWCSKRASKLSR